MSNEELQTIITSKTFTGFTEKSIHTALNCLNAKKETYIDSSQLLQQTKKINQIPFILEGSIDISIINNAGNKFLMNRFIEGDLLVAPFDLGNYENEMLDIRTHGKTRLLILDLSQLYNSEKNDCPYKTMLLQNILYIFTKKIISLQKKFQVITQKSLKDKLLVQLTQLSITQHSKNIQMPYNREELAQGICAERSAVSRELNNMKNDKVIDISKNLITLLQ